MKRWVVFCLLAVMMVWSASAEGEPVVPTPERVELAASDGQILVGDIYTPSESVEGGSPAVLVMHQNRSKRSSWEPLIPALVDTGYVVLSVDLRGHGETGGTVSWTLAQEDTQAWLGFLLAHEAVNPEKIATLGASIGSNLALVGCAANDACETAIALSPGLNFFGVEPEEAVSDGLRRRSALLIAARGDTDSAVAVRQMAGSSQGALGLRVYEGFAHGTDLFDDNLESVKTLIISWLNEAFAE